MRADAKTNVADSQAWPGFATTTDSVIRKILTHLGLDTKPPPIQPAHAAAKLKIAPQQIQKTLITPDQRLQTEAQLRQAGGDSGRAYFAQSQKVGFISPSLRGWGIIGKFNRFNNPTEVVFFEY
jgi:hypothetical protein